LYVYKKTLCTFTELITAKMKSIHTFLIFLYIINIRAQIGPPLRPFEKINYTGIAPIWHDAVYNNNVLSDTLDGYNHVKSIEGLEPIIFENKVITAYLQSGPSYVFYGGYIECRDINNGTLLWSHSYGQHDGQHQEVTRLMYIENGQLVTINQLNRDAFDKNYDKSYFPRMIISKRVYDISTGSIISYEHRPFDDHGAYDTNYNVVYFSRNFSFYKEGKNIRYIYQSEGINKDVINSVLLDQSGALISKDTLLFNDLSYYFNFTQLHEDTLLSVQFLSDPYSLVFHYLSPDLKLYKTVTSNYVFDELPGYNLLKLVSRDKTKLLFNNLRNDFYPNSYYEVFIFDVLSGELLQKVSFKDMYAEWGYELLNWENPLDSIIVIHGRFKDKPQTNETYSGLDFLKVGDIDSLSLIREYEPSDLLRLAGPYDFIKLSEEKYLIYFVERGLRTNPITNKISGFDRNGVALSMMLLDLNDLGILSSTEEANSIHLDLNIYPNPGSDIITIHTDVPFSGDVFISDISGRNIANNQQIEIGSNGMTIDISKFESGMYIVHFLSKNGERIMRKVVKM
jgi:Secretion system C-terminal sorting domain